MQWTEFRHGIPPRFLLPLKRYSFQLDFIESELPPEEMIDIAQKFTAVAVDAMRSHPAPSPSALRRQNVEGHYYTMTYGDPTYDFGIQMNASSLAFTKVRCTLENLALTIPLFERMAQRLFMPDTTTSLTSHVFFQRAYRTVNAFDLDVVLGSLMEDPEVMRTNIDVMRLLSNFDENSLVGCLQPDHIFRNDVTLSTEKFVGGRSANVWVTVEAPWTENQRDMSMRFTLRRGDSPNSRLVAEDLFEQSDIVLKFYKEIVIQRILTELFRNTNVLPRIN